MPNTINFDQLIIDRPLDGWFEDKNQKVLAVLDQLSSLSINTSAETKDKTDAQGALLKRFFTSKSVEVSGENAVFSLNLAAIQGGTEVKYNENVELPRIIQVSKSDSPIELPDTPIDGTLIVYGTSDNGIIDVTKQYTKGSAAGAGVYAVTTADGKTTIALPTDATDVVQIKYEYKVVEGKLAARVDMDATSFPKECKATFRILCSDICDTETVRAFYVVFPKFQMSPDFDWTLDTESTQNFSATAFKDYCAKNQLMFYVAMAEDSDEYDAQTNTIAFSEATTPVVNPSTGD